MAHLLRWVMGVAVSYVQTDMPTLYIGVESIALLSVLIEVCSWFDRNDHKSSQEDF